MNFSYFRKPIKNKKPYKTVGLFQIYEAIRNPKYYGQATMDLRLTCWTPEQARAFKAANFDWVTFGGTFTHGSEQGLVERSGLIGLDFDHVPRLRDMFQKIALDPVTLLLFKSPSGDGLKWVTSVDLELSHRENFEAIAAYALENFGLNVDASGKDVCRPCYLPCHVGAYLNPILLPTT